MNRVLDKQQNDSSSKASELQVGGARSDSRPVYQPFILFCLSVSSHCQRGLYRNRWITIYISRNHRAVKRKCEWNEAVFQLSADFKRACFYIFAIFLLLLVSSTILVWWINRYFKKTY